jgi:hypothetical protein
MMPATPPASEVIMIFDFTDFEYLPECIDGCRTITSWLPSRQAADQAGRNHEQETGHKWRVRERMKEHRKKRPEEFTRLQRVSRRLPPM